MTKNSSVEEVTFYKTCRNWLVVGWELVTILVINSGIRTHFLRITFAVI